MICCAMNMAIRQRVRSPYNVFNLANTDSEKFPHNKCGQSEGVSLDRDPSGRKEELVAKCLTLCATKSQTPKCFAVVKAINLRKIRFDKDETGRRGGGKHLICSSDQIVFILADGGDNNPDPRDSKTSRKN